MRIKLVFGVILTALVALMPIAQAYDWQSHYNGDPHYPMVWGHTQTAKYIDKTSLNVQKYDPPYYVIAVAVFYAPDGGYGTMNAYHVERFYYDIDCREMYYYNHHGNGNWIYFHPTYSFTENGERRDTGEAAFYIAYRMKFYGARKWKNDYNDEYSDVFSNDFYDKL